MKRAPYTYGIDHSGKTYWRTLEEHAGSPEFQEAVAREFPDGASELKLDEMSRRSFLTIMGASIGLAGLTGCRRPEGKILPYAKAPEQVIPGLPQYYATAMDWNGTAVGLLVESHGGRPTKIEGNPRHPDSLGAASAWAQASVLDLFDPERSRTPLEAGEARTWSQALAYVKTIVDGAVPTHGKGIAFLFETPRSPTVRRFMANIVEMFNQARIYSYTTDSRFNEREGCRLAFGGGYERLFSIEKADVLLSLDADFLQTEGSALKHSRAFARRRRLEETDGTLNRLYVAESAFTVTGAAADHRLRTRSADIFDLTIALAGELGALGVTLPGGLPGWVSKRKPSLPDASATWIKAVAKDLVANRGKSLVVAGRRHSKLTHALVYLINHALENVGKTISFVPAVDESMDGYGSRLGLAEAMRMGEVQTLIIVGGNPILDTPADNDFAGALAKVPNSIHFSSHQNETSAACHWHLPRAHYLESWGDTRSEDGTLSIVQPLIAPLHGAKSDVELLSAFIGYQKPAYEAVREQWFTAFPIDSEKKWRRALHDGFMEGTAFEHVMVVPAVDMLVQLLQQQTPAKRDGIELTFAPDSHAWDGRYANSAWLQELPDPMTKLTWDNAALISPRTAQKLGVADGDLVEITIPADRNGKPVKVPVMLTPGQADDSLRLTYGQGRKVGVTVGVTNGKPVGFDVWGVRVSGEEDVVTGVTVKPLGEHHVLARTQEHSLIDQKPEFALDESIPIEKRLGGGHAHPGRGIIREATLTRFHKQPDFATADFEYREKGLLSVYNEHKYEGHKWGMVIDLNACTGCNACMVACQSENNIPVVGKEGVLRGRDMHWIRVDRYYEGDSVEDPQAVLQPMTCQQCENAPCETVCPVAATTHSPEGLNDMAYNRCVGTRYCANNCPYKVRRFNFFNYNKEVPELRRMHMNPDVTVRSRGVVEKCTYCVQRINAAKIKSKQPGNEGMVREKKILERDVGGDMDHLGGGKMVKEEHWLLKDGTITTACQQTCPTEAITFGDLNDPKARVTQKAGSPRDYKVLAELNVKPRTSYLARVRNPNPELEAEKPAAAPAPSHGAEH